MTTTKKIEELEATVDKLSKELSRIKEEDTGDSYYLYELIEIVTDASSAEFEDDDFSDNGSKPDQLTAKGWLKLCKDMGLVEDDAVLSHGGSQ